MRLREGQMREEHVISPYNAIEHEGDSGVCAFVNLEVAYMYFGGSVCIVRAQV